MAASEIALDTTLSISEAAERTGLTAHTLRYYERAGLMLRDIGRATSTHRRYTEAEIMWVIFLTRLRSTSMPITEMREYVELVRRGESTVAERFELLLRHRIAVAARLEEAQRALDAIDYKISIYSNQLS